MTHDIEIDSQSFARAMAKHNVQYRIVPITRVGDVYNEVMETIGNRIDNPDFARYLTPIHRYKDMNNFPGMKSVIVASKYNPCHTVSFTLKGQVKNVFVPPGYVHFYTKQSDLQGIISYELAELGFSCERIILPVKLLAVRSGLAKYGRNNISYTPESGSFHFLASFISDLPPETDVWNELELLSECSGCSICSESCPTAVIRDDRFLVHCENCITLFNRNPGIFPDWFKPELLNSLVGCIKCQLACPANQRVKGEIIAMEGFTWQETDTLLSNSDFNQLPAELQEKFTQFGFPELHPIILRNIKALLMSEPEIPVKRDS